MNKLFIISNVYLYCKYPVTAKLPVTPPPQKLVLQEQPAQESAPDFRTSPSHIDSHPLAPLNMLT